MRESDENLDEALRLFKMMEPDYDQPGEWDYPFTLEQLAVAIAAQMPDGFVCRVSDRRSDFLYLADPEGIWCLVGGSLEAIVSNAEDVVSEHTTEPCTIVVPDELWLEGPRD